jgi:hypothetical protein
MRIPDKVRNLGVYWVELLSCWKMSGDPWGSYETKAVIKRLSVKVLL